MKEYISPEYMDIILYYWISGIIRFKYFQSII
jgi:hypothetical protein